MSRGLSAEESIGWPLPLIRSRPPTSALPRPGARASSSSTRCSPSGPARRCRPRPCSPSSPRPWMPAPSGGCRGARKRLAEVEALARRNLRAAEEARRVVVRRNANSSRRKRRRAPTPSARRRRCGVRSNGCGRPRSSAPRRRGSRRRTRRVRSSPTEIERVHEEHAARRRRARSHARDALRPRQPPRRVLAAPPRRAGSAGDGAGEQVRAEEAQRVAERNLEIATETARRRADEDVARFNKVEEAWRTRAPNAIGLPPSFRRSRPATASSHVCASRSRRRAKTWPDCSPTSTCKPRAPTAPKTELAPRGRRCASAEKAAAEAIEGRDLDGIALETTRSELAEKAEALDAERSSSQARIADLAAQLATAHPYRRERDRTLGRPRIEARRGDRRP